MNEGWNGNPWIESFVRPRRALEKLRDGGFTEAQAFGLYFLGSLASAAAGVMFPDTSDFRFGVPGFAAAHVFSLVLYWPMSYALLAGVKLFRGNATSKEIRLFLGWTLLPDFLCVLLFLPLFVLKTMGVLTAAGSVLIVIGLIKTFIQFYKIVLSVIGLSAIGRFSKLKSTASLLLGAILVMGPLLLLRPVLEKPIGALLGKYDTAPAAAPELSAPPAPGELPSVPTLATPAAPSAAPAANPAPPAAPEGSV